MQKRGEDALAPDSTIDLLWWLAVLVVILIIGYLIANTLLCRIGAGGTNFFGLKC